MTLQQQLAFLQEIDKLKRVLRQALLTGDLRQENTAEHSWHVAIAAIILADYADDPVDTMRVVKMLLVHDIVEIDAGDTYAFDEAGHIDKAEREQRAAKRIFGLLPNDVGDQLKALWEEFEDAQTPDARFANAMDQIMPFLHNIWTEGANWKKLQPAFEKVYQRYQRRIDGGSTRLWDYVRSELEEATVKGWLVR